MEEAEGAGIGLGFFRRGGGEGMAVTIRAVLEPAPRSVSACAGSLTAVASVLIAAL